MTTTHNIKKMAGKAILSGGLALAALGMAAGTAQAFNPQPDPPNPVSINPGPEASRPVTVGVNPQRPSLPHISAPGGPA